LDRLYDTGTMKVFTACAVRADQVFELDKRYVHFDTTSVSVYGEYLPAIPGGRQNLVTTTISHLSFRKP